MAITPEQLEEVHDKEEIVKTKKDAYDVAVGANNTAIANANGAQAAWRASVNAGDNEVTRTNLLTAYIAAAVTKILSDGALQVASSAYSVAQTEMNAAVDALIGQETPVP